MTDHNASAITRNGWGIEASAARALGGELDASIRIDTASGTSFCLKSRALDADGSVELETDALTHVGAVEPTLVPAVVSTRDGATTFVDDQRKFWLLEWIDGPLWSDLPRPTPSQQRELGSAARRLQRALSGFEHAAANRTHHWDLRRLDTSISLHLDQCRDDRQRAIAKRALALFSERVAPVLDRLPTSVVHQDINDHNVVVTGDGRGPVAVIDFGDVLQSAAITELAVAMAYAMLRTPHPIDAAAEVAAGWFEDSRPTDDELSVLMPMAIGRLVVNALTWAARSGDQPEYADARSRHTWATLGALHELPLEFMDARLCGACGVDLRADSERRADPTSPLPVHGLPVRCLDVTPPVVNLDPHNDAFDGVDVDDNDGLWNAAVPDLPFALEHGRVRADRSGFADGSGGPETVQLGVELHVLPGTSISLPVDGLVIEANSDRILVAHDGAHKHWSCWSGLDSPIEVGQSITAGTPLGTPVDAHAINVQVLRFAPDAGRRVPRFARPVDAEAWLSIIVDPTAFLSLAVDDVPTHLSDAEVAEQRNSRLASSQRYYYDEPMTLVRASGATFMDSQAHLYLDVLNNVTHVGHGNAHVVEAASRQMARLNTNSRFVYEEMGRLADRLVRTLPDPLEVVFLVCTGSEANDLATRIARQVTGRTNMMVIEGAYHGNTTVVTGLSPNRYRGPGGDGPPATTHEVAQPNLYRGPFGYDDVDAGTNYAASVFEVATKLVAAGDPPAAFIAESLMGTAGQVVFPDGYLASAFEHVRSVGGLCISDEVQVGFGRLGDGFWGFERSGVVPDIVTMGKPMGNGHPIAAVVTTREIADAFDQGMKYFNTFGGNPVSCATANAVLDEIGNHQLQDHAASVGAYFTGRLQEMIGEHAVIGDVRGVGLYLGVELVLDRQTKEPAKALTSAVCERLRELGIVMYPNGDLGNCLKIKPPMVFDVADVDRFVDGLDTALRELA